MGFESNSAARAHIIAVQSTGTGGAASAAPHLPCLTAHLHDAAATPCIAPAARLSAAYAARVGNHKVQIHAGVVIANGYRVRRPRFASSGISWSEQGPDGYRGGSLNALAGGTILSGFIAEGPDAGSAVHSFVNLEVETTDFVTEVCGTEPGAPEVWKPGPPLSISVTFATGKLPVPSAAIDGHEIQMGVLPTQPGVSSVSFYVSTPAYLAGIFAKAEYPVPPQGQVTLAFDGASFTGEMTPLVPPGTTATKLRWRGHDAAAAARIRAAAEALAISAADDPPMSLADLMSQNTAAAAGIAKKKFNDFVVYGMDDSWREQLTSAVKPLLTDIEKAAYQEHAALYENRLADRYLLQQLGGVSKAAGGFSTPLSQSEQDKLTCFWNTNVNKEDGYYEQSYRITQLAYEEACPRIKQYVDAGGGAWAKRLYEALSTKAALEQACLAFIGSGWHMDQINRNAELLTALSPALDQTLGQQKCNYGTLYHSKITSKLVEQFNLSTDLTSDTAVTSLKQFLGQWLQDLSTEIAERLQDPNLQPPLDPGQKAALQELNDELFEAQNKAGGFVALGAELGEQVATMQGSNLLAKLQAWAGQSKWPGRIAKLLVVGGFCYGVIQVIGAFKGWASLSDAAKAQNVIGVVELGVDLCSLVTDLALTDVVARLANLPEEFQGLADDIAENLFKDVPAGEDFFSNSMGWCGDALEEGVAARKSTFFDLFEEGSTFMKGFAVVAAAAAVGFSAYKVYEDFHGSSTDAQKIVDTMMLTANALALVGAIATMVASECAMAVLGPFGAVAGVILAIVAAFLPQPEPERPADKYMDERGRKTLDSTAAPDSGWYTWMAAMKNAQTPPRALVA